MEPFLFFAAAATLVLALGAHNARRRSRDARRFFEPVAREVGGRVSEPKLGTPSLRVPVAAGEAKLSLLHQKGTEVTTDHLRLKLPVSGVDEEWVTRIRTRPTRVVHMQGGDVLEGTQVGERWHVQSTDAWRTKQLLDEEVLELLEEVEPDRRVAVEIRDGRVTIWWGGPLAEASARRVLRLGGAIGRRLESIDQGPTHPR